MATKITADDIAHFHNYDIHVPTRTIFMSSISIDNDGEESGVDAHMAERVIKGLHILDNTTEDGDQPINIIMNNPGGNWYHGMAIHNAIKVCKNHVTIAVYGHAMSMGSIILQAADERVMAEDAKMMIHYGEDGFTGHSKSVSVWAKEGEANNSRMEQILLVKIKEKQPRYRKDSLVKLLNFDTILTAKEAIELGLCDKVLE